MTNTPVGSPLQILVLNCGSSSIKYQLIDMQTESWRIKGIVDRIASPECTHKRTLKTSTDQQEEFSDPIDCPNIQIALKHISAQLEDSGQAVNAVVHRVVHGGERFTQPTHITPVVLQALAALDELAPLHNPANVLGIRVCTEQFPDIPQIAVFDTAFHAQMPAYAHRYAIPEDWHAMGIRRYGFHGSSHHYVAQKAAEYLNKPLKETNLISLHLGNGASVTAIRRGISVETSMGFTPLEGLAMGTRSGDIDPAIVFFVAKHTHKTLGEIENELNQASGLKGLAGTQDMRDLIAACQTGDEKAGLAIDLFCHRGKKYIGAYLAVLGYVDAIVFTGGIGENAPVVREKMLDTLGLSGILLDETRNASATGPCSRIHHDDSAVPVLVIATNEELHMARQALSIIHTAG